MKGKLIIASTLLTAIIASTPLISGFAWAGTLTVTGIVRANCHIFSCPEPSDMHASVYIPNLYVGKLIGMFHPGEVGKVDIPNGQEYQILATCSGPALVSIPYKCVYPHPGGVPIPIFGYQESFIAGSCSGKDDCFATMGPEGASAEANYYWACITEIC